MNQVMATKEAALYLGVSEFYLRNMRHLMHAHDGPEFTVGKHPKHKIEACLYTKEALDQWKESHKPSTGGLKKKIRECAKCKSVFYTYRHVDRFCSIECEEKV